MMLLNVFVASAVICSSSFAAPRGRGSQNHGNNGNHGLGNNGRHVGHSQGHGNGIGNGYGNGNHVGHQTVDRHESNSVNAPVILQVPSASEPLAPPIPNDVQSVVSFEEWLRKWTDGHQSCGYPGTAPHLNDMRIATLPGDEHGYAQLGNYPWMVACDADLVFMNCVARWPGSVHDARILRQSDLFRDFEGNPKPIEGFLLGDSGYMARDWLLTPIPNPTTPAEQSYNFHHSSARSVVERAIGVLKRRWHCLRRLRLEPARACRVIKVCVMLHNQARFMNLDVPSDSESDDEGGDGSDSDDEPDRPANYNVSERVRSQVGKAARDRYVRSFFPPRR